MRTATFFFSRLPHIASIVLLGGFLAIASSLFVVEQTQQVLIVEMGRLARIIQKPGLYFKIPLIQERVTYDNRILTIGLPSAEVTLGDQKRAVVDLFLRYRIQDPVLFYKTLTNEREAAQRLSDLVSGVLRTTLGKVELIDLLSKKRDEIMRRIHSKTNKAMAPLGVDVVDVRIRRTDLPPQNNDAIFKRIISERQKEAMEIRALGEEKQRIVRASARMNGTIVRAQAQKQAGHIRAEGVAKAQAIYRAAYGKDPEFARFYQSVQGAAHVLSDNTTHVLSPQNILLSEFQQNPPKMKP